MKEETKQDCDELAYVVVMKRVRGDTPKLCKVLGDILYFTPEDAGRDLAGADADIRSAYEVREIKVTFSKKGEELWPDFTAAVEKGYKQPKQT